MVSRADVQRLIQHPHSGKQILSVFLDMSVNSDNKRTYGVFLAKQKSRFPALDSDREGHHRAALGAAFARVERWIDDNFDGANKGLAVHTEVGGDWIEGFQVATPLRNRLELGERPIIGPLAEAVERHPLYGVLVVDRESLRLLRIRSGQLLSEHELRPHTYPTPHDVHAGGEAQKSYQKFKEQERRTLYKDFAREVEEFDRRHQPEYFVLLGTEENIKVFIEFLALPLRVKLVHTGPGPAGPRTSDIVQQLVPFFTARAAEEETRVVELLRDRVRNGHYAAAGVHQTLEQLQEGKVETLVIARDLQERGAECRRCGFLLARHDGACPYCGGEIRDGVDIGEAMIRLAEEQEATVEFVNRQSLVEVDGAGALLRF